ncbi:two-component system KDP operon response regulator KdpE [Endobacter medicaginis]|jgi:two-component system, OmpR family, KDP operon response regulator KdpE|uniref:Response regulator n=1 Tax=Endobacter medicaginis TaxID=1181271 RepID=A0A850NUS0_9PROT|nr:response regulator [Endobacter medicaginis]MBB3173998.1 two-component system KDP operon response regulator KdpE [Endobacter medicaginis]MCX5475144.1 response regulator [Endobacter medicaginis]NVN31989.1 response regulator [Endobacter medicaginis]
MTTDALGTHILVIDDEPQIHRFLRPALEAAGYRISRADTARDGLHLAANLAPELILLDLGLPDLDGHQALAELRGFTRVPILILSARDQDGEKIAALDAGADDYVEKPFSVGELLARLRTALRHTRHADAAPQTLSVSGLDLDFAAHRLSIDGAEIPLTPREFALIAVLARNAGRVLTHRQLLAATWGPGHAEDVQYLRVYIGHLRRKLGPAASRLQTEAGIGYRFGA